MGLIKLLRDRGSSADIEQDLCSIAVLRRHVLDASADDIVSAAQQAMDFAPPPYEDRAEQYVSGRAPMFVVRDGPWLFVIHDVATPYFNDEDLSSGRIQCADAHVQRTMQMHQAWLCVDVNESPKDATSTQRMARASKLLAALSVDDACLGVWVPDLASLHPWSPDVLSRLKHADPIAALRRGGPVEVFASPKS